MARSDSTMPAPLREREAPDDLSSVLATPLLDILDLPPRIASFAYAEGLETIGDLARIPPETLLAERNLGRKSVGITREILESRIGVAWEAIACPKKPSEAPEDPDPRGWDSIRRRLSDAQRFVPIGELDLPLGLRQTLERLGVATLGDLARWPRAKLMELPGIGRRTMVKLPIRVNARLDALTDEHVDRPLFRAFLRAVDDLEPKRRFIARARSGLEGPAMSNTEIARALGLTPERVRQLEVKTASALRDRAWARVAESRVELALTDGPVPFAFFATDPWWATALESPPLVAFVVERVLDDLAQVVCFDGAHWLSKHTGEELEDAWSLLVRAAENAVSPISDEDVDALLARAVERLGPCRHVMDRFRDKVLGHQSLRSA